MSGYAQLGTDVEMGAPTKLRASDKFVTAAKGPRNRPEAADVGTAAVSLRRLLQEAIPEWRFMSLGTFCLLCSSATMLALPALFGQVMDGVISNETASDEERRSRFRTLGWQIAGMTLGSACFGVGQGFSFNAAGASLVTRVRKKLFRAICDQTISFFDHVRAGELTSRLSSDVTLLRMALTGELSGALKSLVILTGGVCYLLTLSAKLTLLMLGTVPVVTLLGIVFGKRLKQLQKDVQNTIAASTAEAEEAITCIRTVRLFSAEGHHTELYDAAVDESLSLMKRTALLSSIFGSLIGLLFGAATIGVVAYGVEMVIEHEMTPGLLTSFVLYTFTITGAVGKLTGVATSLMRVAGASERIYSIIDNEPEHNLSQGLTIDKVQGEVHLRAVCFEYPARPSVQILQSLDLTLPAGHVTALVGASGGGKSTIAGLIARIYRPNEGQITLDGVDIQELDLSWLHQHVVSVSQEPILFSGSISENILYGCSEHYSNEDAMLEAAKAANAHEFIIGFPDGYDTLVGEKGVRLSGGQKQRVAIARALIRQPKVLLLDEATSALDSESEHLVQEALTRSMKNRTVLVIAHRLATVQDADCVVLIEAGQVVAQGTHAELHSVSKTYKNLVEKQILRGLQQGESVPLANGKGNGKSNRLDEVDSSPEANSGANMLPQSA